MAARPPFDPLPRLNEPIVTVLFDPTSLLAIVPLLDNVNVSEPTRLVIVDRSDATAVANALYKRVPLTLTGLCVMFSAAEFRL